MLKRTSGRIALALGAIVMLAPSSEAANISWAAAASGVWSNPANWSPAQVPGPGDTAFINVTGTYTVSLDGPVTVDAVNVGTLTGSQTLRTINHSLTITTGNSTVSNEGTLDIQNATVDGGGTILNTTGAVELTDATIDCNLTNAGLLDTDGATAINGTFTTTGSAISRVNSGTLTVANSFSNQNQFQMLTGGTGLTVTSGSFTNNGILLCSGPAPARALDVNLVNNGTMTVAAGVELTRADAAHVNNGTINCFVGDFNVNQSGATPSFANDGILFVSSGRIFSCDAGTFTNGSAGAVRGEGLFDFTGCTHLSSGETAPGSGTALMTHAGDFTQDGSGSLVIEIGGLGAGSDYDQLAIVGDATFDGTLDVSLVGGFIPTAGQTFDIATFASLTGDFSDLSSLDVGGGIFFTPQISGSTYTLLAEQDPDNVSPVDPGVCITPASPTLTIDMDFTRLDVSQVRGYSVTFEVTGGLELVDGLNSIVEGAFLSGFCGGGCTAVQKIDNGGGSYTFDATILGANCGPDTGGTLFTVEVTDAAGDGTGDINVTAVDVRDCNNQPVPGEPGAGITIDIDLTAPTQLALAAAQVKTGNDTSGTTGIQVDLTGIEALHTVEVFRKGFGDYPTYAAGSVPTAPASPADAITEGWTLTSLTTASGVDEPATRDFYYYVGFQTSACGVVTPVSNVTDGALNYHLGDTSDGITQGQGDNAVGTVDLSLLGGNYLSGNVPAVAYLDFGPTEDFTPDSRPTPDGVIGFEELILTGINFNQVSLNEPLDPVAGNLTNEAPKLRMYTAEGLSKITARVVLEGNKKSVKGVHSLIEYDRSQLELIDVTYGRLLDQTFTKHVDVAEGLVLDAVVMGRNQTLKGSGDLAVLEFRVLEMGARPELAEADLRDNANRRLLDKKTTPIRNETTPDADRTTEIPSVTQFLGARPNPFAAHTDIAFRLAQPGEVRVAVHDISGRLVRSLVNGSLAAGEHRMNWDGKNDLGREMPAGVYVMSFQAPGLKETSKIQIAR